MSTQPTDSSVKPAIGRRRWWVNFWVPLLTTLPLLVVLTAVAWDHDSQMKRLKHMENEVEQIQSRVDAVQRAVDERQIKTREKRPAPEHTKHE